jgi:hypothetical protein
VVRLLSIALLAGLFTACGPDTTPARQVTSDPVKQPWYGQNLMKLTELNREAGSLFAKGDQDGAADLMKQGEGLSHRLLEVPRPTLEATEAAGDLDQLNGRMYFANHRYGWARLQFQKNLVRWKYWKPSTPETERRLKLAHDSIADCDRMIFH